MLLIALNYMNHGQLFCEKKAQNGGNHEIHREECSRKPVETNLLYLGNYYLYSAAVVAASNFFNSVKGCCRC